MRRLFFTALIATVSVLSSIASFAQPPAAPGARAGGPARVTRPPLFFKRSGSRRRRAASIPSIPPSRSATPISS
jgi:hypothetical protein